MSKTPHQPVLGDHVPVKKKLVSPFVHRIGSTMLHYSWARQLAPEAIWMVLLIDRFGFQPARELCSILAQAAVAAVGRDDQPAVVKLSRFKALTNAEQAFVVARLGVPELSALRIGLAPLAAVVADHPLAFLGQPEVGKPSEDERFPQILKQCYDRNSRLAVLAMALAESLMLDQGKLFIAEHLMDNLVERFRVIGDYPDTEASRTAAGGFRAAASMLFMTPMASGQGYEPDDPWVREFWEGVAGFGPCIFDDTLQEESVPDDADDPMSNFIVGFRNAIRADLRARLDRWPLDLNQAEAYEVIAGLLCRQATLALEFSTSPHVWTPNSAPMFLRAIADVFISLAWILRDPVPRAKLFVEDGLGAIKLQIAHQERALEATQDLDERAQLRAMIEMWKGWLTSQRIEVFVEVNLGAWSGLSTRKMAQEAGFLDFYNHVYQPFSNVAHSNWSHVSVFNTVPCDNPAHRGHKVPALLEFEPDPHWLGLAAKYISKTLDHFDEVQDLAEMPHTAFEYISRALAQVASEPQAPTTTQEDLLKVR
jgi:hypothetical protein